MKSPQVVRGHIRANVPALNGAGILIESEVDPAKHPRVVESSDDGRRPGSADATAEAN